MKEERGSKTLMKEGKRAGKLVGKKQGDDEKKGQS